jgi:hypothetical protein
MGDFIVGNETVDRRRERRDAKMALEQGLSTEAVQARTLGFVWLRNCVLIVMLPSYCFVCSFRSSSSEGAVVSRVASYCEQPLLGVVMCDGVQSLCVALCQC